MENPGAHTKQEAPDSQVHMDATVASTDESSTENENGRISPPQTGHQPNSQSNENLSAAMIEVEQSIFQESFAHCEQEKLLSGLTKGLHHSEETTAKSDTDANHQEYTFQGAHRIQSLDEADDEIKSDDEHTKPHVADRAAGESQGKIFTPRRIRRRFHQQQGYQRFQPNTLDTIPSTLSPSSENLEEDNSLHNFKSEDTVGLEQQRITMEIPDGAMTGDEGSYNEMTQNIDSNSDRNEMSQSTVRRASKTNLRQRFGNSNTDPPMRGRSFTSPESSRRQSVTNDSEGTINRLTTNEDVFSDDNGDDLNDDSNRKRVPSTLDSGITALRRLIGSNNTQRQSHTELRQANSENSNPNSHQNHSCVRADIISGGSDTMLSFGESTSRYPPPIQEEEERQNRQRAFSEPDRSRAWFIFNRRSSDLERGENSSHRSHKRRLSGSSTDDSIVDDEYLECTEEPLHSNSIDSIPQEYDIESSHQVVFNSLDNSSINSSRASRVVSDGNDFDSTDSSRSSHDDPNREARRNWMIINQRFQLLLIIVAFLFSILLFSILVCWVVMTSAFVVSIEKECDVPLKIYFWLATIQLVLDVFRKDIMRSLFGWDPDTTTHVPHSVIIFNITYLAYAMIVLRMGVVSIFSGDSQCSDTAPDLFTSTKVFILLSLVAWLVIILGYLVPFCVVAFLLTRNGYSPSSDINGDGLQSFGVFPVGYTGDAAPPGCIDHLQVVKVEEFPDHYPKECCICMVEFSSGDDIVKTECDHVFHKRCCETWLNQARTCPVCRSDIPSALNLEDNHDGDGNDDDNDNNTRSGPRINPSIGLTGLPFRSREFRDDVVSLVRMIGDNQRRVNQNNI